MKIGIKCLIKQFIFVYIVIWGGFSVNNATLNRFFSLHFVLPFVLAALALTHLIVLHDTAGSGNPLGISGNYDRLPFSPYYIFKDLITIFLFIFVLSLFVFFMPNILGDSENYVMANPMQTPAAIVPEWYLLPFYAILRSIPNKLFGVIAMFSAILALLLLPVADISRSRGMQFRPLNKVVFYIFIANFLILMQLGAKHVESPFIEFGQLSTLIYFLYFIVILYFATLIENSFTGVEGHSNKYFWSGRAWDMLSWDELVKTVNEASYALVNGRITVLNKSGFGINRNILNLISLILIFIFLYLFYLNMVENTLECSSGRAWLDYFKDNTVPPTSPSGRGSHLMNLLGIESSTSITSHFNNDFSMGPNKIFSSLPDLSGSEDGATTHPVPGRRCPNCLERGDTVWVIPGKCCPQCGTPVN